MEGAHFKSSGKLVSLSEQNLVDCSRKEHNMGCLMDNAFKYVIANKGIDTEASYPYNATTGKTCKFNQTNIGATISSFKDIPRNSEMVRVPDHLSLILTISFRIYKKLLPRLAQSL